MQKKKHTLFTSALNRSSCALASRTSGTPASNTSLTQSASLLLLTSLDTVAGLANDKTKCFPSVFHLRFQENSRIRRAEGAFLWNRMGKFLFTRSKRASKLLEAGGIAEKKLKKTKCCYTKCNAKVTKRNKFKRVPSFIASIMEIKFNVTLCGICKLLLTHSLLLLQNV